MEFESIWNFILKSHSMTTLLPELSRRMRKIEDSAFTGNLLVILLQTACLLLIGACLIQPAAAKPFQRTKEPVTWQGLPTPASGFTPIIDPTFKSVFQNNELGIQWYEEKLKERQALIKLGRGDEFSVPELKYTLHNIFKFISTLIIGKHFPSPLDENEKVILITLQNDLMTLLMSRKPSYNKTIRVIFTFTMIYDHLVYNHIIEPLLFPKYNWNNQLTELLQPVIPYTDISRKFTFIEYNPQISLKDIYQDFMSLGAQEFDFTMWTERYGIFFFKYLFTSLNDERIILYPSFNPLDIDDFARLAPVPVYPLGLMDQYMLNADGIMHTPMEFMLHDAFHIQQHSGYKYVDGTGPMENPYNRLAFINSALDAGAHYLSRHSKAKKAVELALFNIFHEHSLQEGIEMLSGKKHKLLYQSLYFQQTEKAFHFSPEYGQLSKHDLLSGSVWVYELYKFWLNYNQKTLSADDMTVFYENHFLPALNREQLSETQ